MKSDFQTNLSVISVQTTELVLTPLTCASLVNEILKNLVYQKQQIPYSYNWLERAIKRKQNEEEINKTLNLSVERYYRLASSTYDAMENIMKHVENEFLCHENLIKEVLILFGSTPVCAKEMFSIKIPFVNKGHNEENHIKSIYKYQHQILSKIFFSEDWMRAMETSVPLTNTFVMLKKVRKTTASNSNDFFVSKSSYCVPLKTKCCAVEILDDRSSSNDCCNNLSIYSNSQNSEEDCVRPVDISQKDEETETDVVEWYQAKLVVKGFKDLFINKVSASELW